MLRLHSALLERSSLIELEQLQLEGISQINTLNTDQATNFVSQTCEVTEKISEIEVEAQFGSQNTEATGSSMVEFYQLVQELLLITLALIGISFTCVWIFYSPNIALNYLIGACTGLIYLRMMVKDVEGLGRQKAQLSKTRLALLIGLILVASRVEQLEILPIFLGFLTYKITIILYVIRTSLPSFLR
jgi:ATP synthase protein I